MVRHICLVLSSRRLTAVSASNREHQKESSARHTLTRIHAVKLMVIILPLTELLACKLVMHLLSILFLFLLLVTGLLFLPLYAAVTCTICLSLTRLPHKITFLCHTDHRHCAAGYSLPSCTRHLLFMCIYQSFLIYVAASDPLKLLSLVVPAWSKLKERNGQNQMPHDVCDLSHPLLHSITLVPSDIGYCNDNSGGRYLLVHSLSTLQACDTQEDYSTRAY